MKMSINGDSDNGSPNTDFLTSMIKHHEDALAMSREYLKVSAKNRLAVVSDLAESIIKGQSAEIERMRSMIRIAKEAGLP